MSGSTSAGTTTTGTEEAPDRTTKTFWYQDDCNKWHAVVVKSSVAKVLTRIERACRRKNATWRRRHVALSTLARPGEDTPDPERLHKAAQERLDERKKRDNGGSAWAGPRLPTRVVLASSLPGYNGDRRPGERGCGICRGRPLAIDVYCPSCHRHGADALLPVVTSAERPKAYVPDDHLGGGRGKARPKGKAARGKKGRSKPARSP